jgi:hypothetical protein
MKRLKVEGSMLKAEVSKLSTFNFQHSTFNGFLRGRATARGVEDEARPYRPPTSTTSIPRPDGLG